VTASQLTWPLRVAADGELATVEQNSPEDVQSCVTAILSYPREWRPDNMDFGRPDDVLFAEGGADVAAIAEALTDLEPRVTPDIVASAIEQGHQGIKVHTGAANG
jgi:hypothetical protein